jgi:hypothetical protein
LKTGIEGREGEKRFAPLHRILKSFRSITVPNFSTEPANLGRSLRIADAATQVTPQAMLQGSQAD